MTSSVAKIDSDRLLNDLANLSIPDKCCCGIYLGLNKSELEKYLDEKVEDNSPDFDILAWWKGNKGKYPIMARIAKDIIAIPVSTVASESAFSTGGRFLSPHRRRLHPDTLEALMCAQNWIWAPLQGGVPEEEMCHKQDEEESSTS